MRLIGIFTFFGIIANGVSSIVKHPPNLRWPLSATENPNTEKPKLERVVCNTQQCEKLAKSLIESMNHTMDPCEDFYEYACGNWEKHNPLPKGEKRWNLLAKGQKEIDDRLKVLMEMGPQPGDLHATKVAKRAFKACTDTDELERVGLEPLISTLWRAGGWPLIMEEDEWDERVYKWQNLDDYYARLTGRHSLHDVVSDIDYMNLNATGLVTADICLYITTPNLQSSMYKLLNSDELERLIDMDDDEGPEGSQEGGSEQRGRYVPNNEDDSKEDNDDEGEDVDEDDDDDDDEIDEELKLRRIRIARRRLANRIIYSKRRNNGVPTIRKHVEGKKMEERTKRSIIKSKVHNKKHYKEKTTVNEKMNYNADKVKQLSLKLRNRKVSYSSSNKGLTKIKGNSERNKDTDNDLYFAVNEDNNDNNDANEKENNSINDSDKNNSESDIDIDENISGSGDTESDDEDGSGSGDHEWDNEDGSGDTDDNESGDDSNESGDSAEKRKEVEEFRKTYAEYILNVSISLSEARGVPISRERLSKDIADMIKFQIEMMEYIFIFMDQKNMTLRSFQRRYDASKPTTSNGKVNWIKKVQDLFSNGGMELHKNTHVLVSSFEYFTALRKLLDRTPSRTIVNYVHWNFISRMLKVTTEEMRELYNNWDGKEPDDIQRTGDCVNEVGAEYILGYEYVKRYLPEKVVQTASDMVDDIQKEVEYEIKKSPWMDADIRNVILNKLVYMKKFIGYPDSYKNATIMKGYFKGHSVTNSHFDNTLSLMKYMKWENLKLSLTNKFPVDADVSPLMVNAFFSPFENKIEITAADFQPPLYDSNQPWYTNYGIIGLVMSHEVNHGFDDSGRWFDKVGTLAEWSLDMQEEYDKRLKCFVDQFTRYSVVDNKTGNITIEDYGEQTSGENIADTMGLKAVFKAYQRRLRECDRPDPMLPGLEDLSNEQLFFLSFANLWCEVEDPEKLPSLLKSDPHSPGYLRVIGSISNSEDFAKAYNCPVGSAMNPKEKCNIWK